MNTFKNIGSCIFAFCLTLSLVGCQNVQPDPTQTQTSETTENNSTPVTIGDSQANTQDIETITTAIDTENLFSDRDLSRSYDQSTAILIQLNETTASCSSDAVKIDGGIITITDEGVYLLSGSLTDGQIIINAAKDDKVQLVLNGVNIVSKTSAAIYSLEADKVFLTLPEGTENTLANGGDYVAIDDNAIDAVIFSKTDLTLNGAGKLAVNAQAGHGVVSKDELTITGGDYTITAAKRGLSAKDSIAISDGVFAITSDTDGIHAENAEDASRGFIYILSGVFDIHAQEDAVSASSTLQIDGGTYDLTTGDGSESTEMKTGGDFKRMKPDDGFDPMKKPVDGSEPIKPEDGSEPMKDPNDITDTPTEPLTTTEEDSVSQKGIKAAGNLTINGGSFSLDTADDSFHTEGELLITAGEFHLSSGDDAIHCDGNLTIKDGSFTIPYCYEGIEGATVTIDDGTFDINSYDDSINGADGMGGSVNSIVINGGSFTIVSDGDCVDSNGDLTINGGSLNLTCNGNGNTALDCDGSYAHNGGDITTNDGSEANPGAMGGHGGNKKRTDGDFPDGERPKRPSKKA